MTTDSKRVVRLECWSVRQGPDAEVYYQAPELIIKQLHGRCYGHPRIADGELVTTSPIVSVFGRMVCTKTGTSYLLGTPDPGYIKWLEANGHPFDPEHPIRVINQNPSQN